MTAPDSTASPKVSVIIANYGGATYLVDCLTSVRRQTLGDIEILVSDDASPDESTSIVTSLMRIDPRIRLITSNTNSGPAATRNRALKAAKGEWVAIVDSDDFIHPARLETLLRAAHMDGADIVADDLLTFDADHETPPRSLLKGRSAASPFWVDAAAFIRSNRLYSGVPCLGYLKPIIRSSILSHVIGPYDETLRIGEDYDLLVRLLKSGAKFRVYPILHYFWRRHTNSTSHRLNEGALTKMLAADALIWQTASNLDHELTRAIKSQSDSVKLAISYERLLQALKGSQYWYAVTLALTHPRAFFLLRLPAMVRLHRMIRRFKRHRTLPAPTTKQVCIISRQRVVGRTNGSSTYLLDVATALAARGLTLHFLSPSPVTLGRWPFLTLRKEISVFATFQIRGTWRIGRYVISRDPLAFVRGAVAHFDKLLVKLGILSGPILQAAPYSIGLPLTREDQLFLARVAPHVGDYLIADYCFLTDAFPYTLRPDARTAVIMHDLFSSRTDPFEAISVRDTVASLSEEAEIRFLAQADCIVAVQPDEANVVRRHLPKSKVIVAPIAAKPVSRAQPGDNNIILFIGSNTAPNTDGLRWFLETCWPSLSARRPNVRFLVAGSVSLFFGPPPQGVKYLGLVANLAPLYEAAGVVIAPLRAGSGLKVKLIEALARGKAVVASPTTMQGVNDLLSDVVRVAENADDFVESISTLLDHKEQRATLATKGLEAIASNFSADRCYSALISEVLDAHPIAS